MLSFESSTSTLRRSCVVDCLSLSPESSHMSRSHSQSSHRAGNQRVIIKINNIFSTLRTNWSSLSRRHSHPILLLSKLPPPLSSRCNPSNRFPKNFLYNPINPKCLFQPTSQKTPLPMSFPCHSLPFFFLSLRFQHPPRVYRNAFLLSLSFCRLPHHIFFFNHPCS